MILAEIMRNCENVEVIILSKNRISEIGVSMLAEMLETCSTWKNLFLNENSLIGDIGAIRMAEALEINTSLVYLNLSGCEITDIGTTRIAEMVGKKCHLKTLSLSNNPIGDEGAIRMADAIERNTSLTMLELQHCNITKRSGQMFIQALEMNTTLCGLYLDGGKIGIETCDRILKLSKKKRDGKRDAAKDDGSDMDHDACESEGEGTTNYQLSVMVSPPI
eukprot:TRINITY_DN589_c0_g2_i4.p1 TRINITY_DN589_c0_g2~~TRINITY_DN589_c0_g2_i4.p1  ORF type:complete len:220 (-),score=58.43 TRINITY_DN589_c0_g2_i4:720-1379(-)